MEQEEFLTTGEAAEVCGVSRSTLRRAVAQGHLRAWHTPGNHLRFSRSDCVALAQTLGRVDLVGHAAPSRTSETFPSVGTSGPTGSVTPASTAR
ncbi:MAG: MerR family transcriptional regulator [Candidatus Dormibacteria bacterium]